MPKRKPSKTPCGVADCGRPQVARAMCQMHYHRWRTTGDVQAHIPPQGRAGAPNRPKVDGLVMCIECNEMLPQDAFAPRRSRCRPCFTVHSRRLHEKRKEPCIDCGAMASKGAERCRPCADIAGRRQPSPDWRFVTSDGYVKLGGYHGHPNARNKNGYIAEHVKVMCDMIGRPLLPGENVHHKNGVRDDNRPENLELWVVNQPAGQRPEDLVAWAKEILRRYDSHDLRLVS